MSVPSKTILIVEDNPDIRQTLREALEFEGYEVFSSEDGLEGLRMLRRLEKPCLVILDYRMPVLDGREFLKIVRADPDLAQTPILVLSAHADANSVHGANAFMRKPPDLDRLMALVEQHLSDR